jgi:O-antigen/teichoic acid export membrane protein
MQNDPARFARYYLRVVNLVTWIATPIFGFLFVAAKPVIVLVLGRKWVEAAPVFQFLAIAALAQLLFSPTTWLFVCRGQSGRLLKLLLILTPIFFAGYAIGLPFGIKGVALTGSLVFVAVFPWVLSYTFRGTDLTLQRFGKAILCPVSVGFAAVFSGELALHLVGPQGTVFMLLAVALGFVAAYSLSALIPPVWREATSLRNLLRDLRSPIPTVQAQSQPALTA